MSRFYRVDLVEIVCVPTFSCMVVPVGVWGVQMRVFYMLHCARGTQLCVFYVSRGTWGAQLRVFYVSRGTYV